MRFGTANAKSFTVSFSILVTGASSGNVTGTYCVNATNAPVPTAARPILAYLHLLFFLLSLLIVLVLFLSLYKLGCCNIDAI